MKEQIRSNCELLTKNRTNIADKFLFENGLMIVAAGLIYTGADKEADVDRLAACRKILKNSLPGGRGRPPGIKKRPRSL